MGFVWFLESQEYFRPGITSDLSYRLSNRNIVNEANLLKRHGILLKNYTKVSLLLHIAYYSVFLKKQNKMSH